MVNNSVSAKMDLWWWSSINWELQILVSQWKKKLWQGPLYSSHKNEKLWKLYKLDDNRVNIGKDNEHYRIWSKKNWCCSILFSKLG